MGGLGDEKAAVVGPEIERRVGIAGTAARPAVKPPAGRPPLRTGGPRADRYAPRGDVLPRIRLRNGFVLDRHSTIPEAPAPDQRPGLRE